MYSITKLNISFIIEYVHFDHRSVLVIVWQIVLDFEQTNINQHIKQHKSTLKQQNAAKTGVTINYNASCEMI